MTLLSRPASPNRLPLIAGVVFALAAAGGIGVGLLGGALVGRPAVPGGNGGIAWPAATPNPLKRPTAIVPVLPAPQFYVDEELRDGAEDFVDGLRDRAQPTKGPVLSLN